MSMAKAGPELNVRIANVGVGQVLGFEDVILKRNYTTTVRCISTSGQIYAIKAEDFEQKLKKSDKTWKALIDSSYSKDIELLNKIYSSVKNRKCKLVDEEQP